MMRAYAAVERLIRTELLADHQIATLIDFAFNCGAGNPQASTLRRVINRGELCRWVYAAGVKLSGLARRWAAEAELRD